MKLFIYEHITSGALAHDAKLSSLAQEGEMMMQAALKDALACPDVAILTLRDSRLPPLPISPQLQSYTIKGAKAFDLAWHDALSQADAVLIIAPESDGLLADINQRVLNQGKILLGCQAAAVNISTDKYACSQLLSLHGLNSPIEYRAHEWDPNSFSAPDGLIAKPIHGVGCEATHYFQTITEAQAWTETQPQHALRKTLIQAYETGEVISLTILCGDTDCRVLAINQQHILQQGQQISFSGVTVNGIPNKQFSMNAANVLAKQVHSVIPGLWGLIGIDLILNNRGAVILDINPRLTTAYVGLSQSLNINPIQQLINLIKYKNTNLVPIMSRKAVKISL